MYCKECGKLIPEDSKFCFTCGAKQGFTTQPVEMPRPVIEQPAMAQPAMERPPMAASKQQTVWVAAQPQIKMNWHKFLIYFALFGAAAGNAISGFSCLSLMVSVYEFIPIETLLGGVGYGVLLLGLAPLAIYARQKLAGYKEDAPAWLMIYLSASMVVALTFGSLYISALPMIFPKLFRSIVGDMTTWMVLVNIIVGLAAGLIQIFANGSYYKRRQDLFVK